MLKFAREREFKRMLFRTSLRAKRGNPALYLKGNSGLPRFARNDSLRNDSVRNDSLRNDSNRNYCQSNDRIAN
jgi:hypothetical protein